MHACSRLGFAGIKEARQSGIHCSPTTLVNGVVDESISSSWTAEQWDEFLPTIITPASALSAL